VCAVLLLKGHTLLCLLAAVQHVPVCMLIHSRRLLMAMCLSMQRGDEEVVENKPLHCSNVSARELISRFRLAM